MNGRALLVSPLGFLIGISLGALGGGGSILAVPILVYAAGESPQAATTTSLIVVGAASFLGMFAHLRAGRVRVVPGIMFGLAGIGGSVVGTRLNHAVDANILLLAFAGLMALAAWRMWVNQAAPGAGDEDFERYPEPEPGRRRAAACWWRPALGSPLPWCSRSSVPARSSGSSPGSSGSAAASSLCLPWSWPSASRCPKPSAPRCSSSPSTPSSLSSAASAPPPSTGPSPFPSPSPLCSASRSARTIADRLPTVTLVRWFVGLLVALAVYVSIRAGLALVST